MWNCDVGVNMCLICAHSRLARGPMIFFLVIVSFFTYWAPQKNLVKGCRQTLDGYCASCELLSASIADALWFVNMVCLPLIAERNAHEICLTQECLQIVRRLLWKQTTTHSLRNNNPMFDGNLWPNSFEEPSTIWSKCCLFFRHLS